MTTLNIFTAFLAGIASFLAPCTFSTIPIFLSYISGVSLADYEKDPSRRNIQRRRVFGAAMFYALGFILFFCFLGLGLNFLGGFFTKNRDFWRIISGIVMILLGIYMLFQNRFRIEFLLGEYKIRLPSFAQKGTKMILFGAFLIGFVNAFAWSPCIGPIYGQIVTLSLSGSNSGLGFIYSLIYGLGLMVPFISIALFFGSSQKIVGKLSKYSGRIYKVLAVLFIILGILIATDLFDILIVQNFARIFALFGYNEVRLPI